MMDEIMVPVDPACIPEGWEVVRVASAKEGEFIAMCYGIEWLPYKCHKEKNGVCLIIRGKYEPGIPLPKGWWVWQCPEDAGVWVASQVVDDCSGKYIWGIEHIPGFVPPPDGKPRHIT